jgi:hypothetical protein
MWGAVVWLVVEIAAANAMSPGSAIVCSTATYLAAGAITFMLAGGVRKQVRSPQFVLFGEHLDPRSAQLYAAWKEVAVALIAADELLRCGKASLVEHELIWWQAYDRLEAVNKTSTAAATGWSGSSSRWCRERGVSGNGG